MLNEGYEGLAGPKKLTGADRFIKDYPGWSMAIGMWIILTGLLVSTAIDLALARAIVWLVFGR